MKSKKNSKAKNQTPQAPPLSPQHAAETQTSKQKKSGVKQNIENLRLPQISVGTPEALNPELEKS